jgi:hypothetical protein
MRTRFTEHVSDLSNDLADADIDEYLNRAYQYTIPADVGGEFSEGFWKLTTVIGTDTYVYGANIIAQNGEAAWINSYYDAVPAIQSIAQQFLDVETDRAVFQHSDRTDPPVSGRPTSILFYGREVTLSHTPDLAYVIKVPCRAGPEDPLDSLGIPNDIHAMASVTAAALEFLAEAEDEDGAMREQALYESYRSRLNVYAQARPNSRRRKRSF